MCGPCLPLVRHPAELANGDPVKLLAALWQVLREVGGFTVGISVLFTIPLMVLQVLELGPVWLPSLLVLGVMTLVESVAAFVFRDRVLAANPRAPVAWRAALLRSGAIFGVNLVGSIGMTVCLPLSLVYGPLLSAVVIAALEGRGPIDSFVLAWKRSEGQRIGLAVAAIAPMVPAFVIYLLSAFGSGAAAASGAWRAFSLLSALTLLVFVVVFVPANLFQVVVWLATRPQPQRVDAASS